MLRLQRHTPPGGRYRRYRAGPGEEAKVPRRNAYVNSAKVDECAVGVVETWAFSFPLSESSEQVAGARERCLRRFPNESRSGPRIMTG